MDQACRENGRRKYVKSDMENVNGKRKEARGRIRKTWNNETACELE